MDGDIFGISSFWESVSHNNIFESITLANADLMHAQTEADVGTAAGKVSDIVELLRTTIDGFVAEVSNYADNPTLSVGSSQLRHLDASSFGAVPNDGIDDTAALQKALNQSNSLLTLAPGVYQISGPLDIKGSTHDVILSAYGACIEASGQNTLSRDAITIYGWSNAAAHNIVIMGLEIHNANDIAFSVYGQGPDREHPYNVSFIDTKTYNSCTAGIFVNSASGILVYNHTDEGSARGISFMSPGAEDGPVSPLSDPYAMKNIAVLNSHVSGTDRYAYQFYFGKNILFYGNYADGSSISLGEQAAVVFDRSENVLAFGNHISSAPKDQILLNGTTNVVVADNTVSGGLFGIEALFNYEAIESPNIGQSVNTLIVQNITEDTLKSGIVFHGASGGIALGNQVSTQSEYGIYVTSSSRPEDGAPMVSSNIALVGNAVDHGGIATSFSEPVMVGSNTARLLMLNSRDYNLNNLLLPADSDGGTNLPPDEGTPPGEATPPDEGTPPGEATPPDEGTPPGEATPPEGEALPAMPASTQHGGIAHLEGISFLAAAVSIEGNTVFVGNKAFVGVKQFVFSDGTITRSSAAEGVDGLFYMLHNRDVFKAGMDAGLHYRLYGASEGRDPNAFFSTVGYLALRADVAAAGMNPLEHYAKYGWREGQDPSASFDTEAYLLHNPDVAAAGMNPLVHYLIYGISEGRETYVAVGRDITPDGFDAEFYLLANPDVARSGMDPYLHFEQYGRQEGRAGAAYSLANFNANAYLLHNLDVASAGVDPLLHYLRFGFHEGRKSYI